MHVHEHTDFQPGWIQSYKPVLIALHTLPNVGRKRLFQVMKALSELVQESIEDVSSVAHERSVESEFPSLPTLQTHLEMLKQAMLVSSNRVGRRHHDTDHLLQTLTPSYVTTTLYRLVEERIHVLLWGEFAYPEMLVHIPDPPPLLYVKGKVDLLTTEALAVVGTRRPTPYGLRATRELTQAMALSGLTIVSGLAEGVDAMAHRVALSIHGRTVAVLGSSHDHLYPRAHEPLYEEIVQEGAVLTEYPLGTRPARGLFPERNRLISGLSMGVLVIEGHLNSGSMITAQHALEQGRDVFAVPGPIFSAQSAGPHRLIQEGAKLVHHPQDILDEMQLQGMQELSIKAFARGHIERTRLDQATPTLPHDLDVYLKEAVHFDDLVIKTALSPEVLLSILMPLVVAGTVEKLPGHRYRLRFNEHL